MSGLSKCIVAGGAGFIGSNLVNKLLSFGYKVLVLDNLITGKERNLPVHENLTFVNVDISDRIKLIASIPQEFREKISSIYHLASPASPTAYYAHPFETIWANVWGTENLIQMARITGAKFIFTSTSEVYGDPGVFPTPEDYFGNVNSFGPRSCYDESKRIAETIIYNHQIKDGLDARIIRVFNTFGPNMQVGDGRVVSNFICAALSGEPLVILGGLKKYRTSRSYIRSKLNKIYKFFNSSYIEKPNTRTRSLCYIDDLIDGLILIQNSNFDLPINLGNDQEIAIFDLALLIKELTSSTSDIVIKTELKDDPKYRRPDLTLARGLGFEPKIELIEGLTKTIEYFKKELK